MEKKIKNILLILKIDVMVVWLFAILLCVLGETGFFSEWVVGDRSQGEFIINCVVICLTIVGLPSVLKISSLIIGHALCRMNNEEAVERYAFVGIVRNLILTLIALCDIVAYYLTGNVTGAFCALITILSMVVFCWPKREQIDEYLEKVNQDEQD